jgi:Family of unknown function (DUF6423)
VLQVVTTQNLPGLEISGRVRARDIQMAGVADLRRRVLLISGAIDTTDYDISLCVNLPEAGRWQVIKSETNLTDQTWVAIQATTDDQTTFVSDAETVVMCRQFAKSFMTPGQRRLIFYDGEVRPGEALLKVYSIETTARRPAYTHSRYSPLTADEGVNSPERIRQMLARGIPQRPVVELIVPLTVIS